MLYYTPTRTSDTADKNVLEEHRYAVQVRLLKGDIVMGDSKPSSNNTLFEHVMSRNGFGNHNGQGKKSNEALE